MSIVAKRMNRFPPSGSVVVTQRARELRAEGRDIISLSIGEPDFPTPEHVKRAAVAAMDRNQTKYTPIDGTLELKQAVCLKFRRDNGLSYKPEQITVGAGGKQVIHNAILSTVEPGDEVIIPTPYWISYSLMVMMAEGVSVHVPCSQENGFKLQPGDLDRAITPKTKWLMLNSPSNPSGATYSRDELKALGDVLLRHPQVHILTDDIYEHIRYDGREFATIAEVEPNLYERTLTVNGVSKAYAMTGWRIGFAGGPVTLIKAMAKLQSQITSGPNSIAQAASVEALTGPQEFMHERAAIFQERRDVVVDLLNQVPGLKCHKPEGAFYVFPSCAGLLGKKTPDGSMLNSDSDVALYLLEKAGVAVVLGDAYGMSPFFRVSYATSMDLLKDGCGRIKRACEVLV